MLAVAEINARGGILGRQAELVIADAGPTHDSAGAGAFELADMEGAEAIIAMVDSSARRTVLDQIRGRIPVIYTPQFEGNETDPTVVAIGDTSDHLIARGLDWLMEYKRVSRFHLVGSDYLWPRRSIQLARALIAGRGGRVTGECCVPFGTDSYEAAIDTIARAQPDLVMFWLVGHEAIMFNRAFAKRGLDAKILRFCTAVEETILFAIGPDCTQNLFTCSSYFSNLRSANNEAFLERYHQSFGDSPPPANAFGQSVYEGIYCLDGLAKAAGNLNAADLRSRIGRVVQSRTARGTGREIAAGGTTHPIHLAVAEGYEFRILTT